MRGGKRKQVPWEVCDWISSITVREGKKMVCRCTKSEQGKNYAVMISAVPDMREALAEAVEKYGKPGGPWNVPGEAGSWIAKAKAALKKADGGAR